MTTVFPESRNRHFTIIICDCLFWFRSDEPSVNPFKLIGILPDELVFTVLIDIRLSFSLNDLVGKQFLFTKEDGTNRKYWRDQPLHSNRSPQ